MNIFFTLLFSHMIACHSIGFATYILEKPFMMYIKDEVLADNVTFGSNAGESVEIEGEKINISIFKK